MLKSMRSAAVRNHLLFILQGVISFANRLELRSVERVFKATAPASSSGTSIYGPRRVIGSQDIEGKGTKHDFEVCDPFIFFDDSLLPRGMLLHWSYGLEPLLRREKIRTYKRLIPIQIAIQSFPPPYVCRPNATTGTPSTLRCSLPRSLRSILL